MPTTKQKIIAQVLVVAMMTSFGFNENEQLVAQTRPTLQGKGDRFYAYVERVI